jgi:hypothetical protein
MDPVPKLRDNDVTGWLDLTTSHVLEIAHISPFPVPLRSRCRKTPPLPHKPGCLHCAGLSPFNQMQCECGSVAMADA